MSSRVEKRWRIMGRVTTAVRQWHVPMQIWWEWMKILFCWQEKDSEPVWQVAVYLRSRFGSLYGGRTFKEQPQYKRTGHKRCDISCQQRDRSEIWREERFRGLQGSERDRDRQGSAVL